MTQSIILAWILMMSQKDRMRQNQPFEKLIKDFSKRGKVYTHRW